jgi:hypothetical protein
MIYEERRVLLKRGALEAYRRLMLEQVWPALRSLGAQPLCLLSGLIGMPATETYSFTGFHDLASWERLQLRPESGPPAGADTAMSETLGAGMQERAELVLEERARLVIPSATRPKAQTPPEERRPIYGMRRFWIRPQDWPEFERQSAAGIWVRIEAQDARILGLFRDAAATDPLEVTLLTGYYGPAHWEATRGWRERPSEIAEDLWQLGQHAAAARNAITLSSYVCLMNAHWPAQ